MEIHLQRHRRDSPVYLYGDPLGGSDGKVRSLGQPHRKGDMERTPGLDGRAVVLRQDRIRRPQPGTSDPSPCLHNRPERCIYHARLPDPLHYAPIRTGNKGQPPPPEDAINHQ
jgi:hypothetical protein